jgi:APA family basic amino acid/polyamine antiporter
MSATEEASPSTPKLVRQLSLVDATMIVMGSMIGSGIFITSAESTRLIGTPGLLLAAWALAGLLTITGSACCAELAAMMPHAGGQYVFLREAYGRPVGFLFGWSLFLVVQTGTIAAVCVAFAKFMGVLVPWVAAENYLIQPISFGSFALSLSTQQLVAIAAIAVLTLTNTRGLKTGTFIQNTFTFTKTAALVALIVLGFLFGVRPSAAAWSSDWWNPVQNGWSVQDAEPGLKAVGTLALLMLLGKAMVGPLFSQTAWSNVTFTGGEVREPGRTLPRALLLGCTSVVILYFLANVIYVCTMKLGEIENAPEGRVATVLMEQILGPYGATVMAIAILISTFGCSNGLILAGARVYYAMARDGLFFSKVGTTNAHHVPAVALFAQGIWAALLTLPRTVAADAATGKVVYGNVYNQLLEYIVSADLSFYTLMVAALIVMRFRAPAAERPYRTWGYPLTPLVYIALALTLVADLVYLAPKTSGIGFALVLTGIPVYLIWRQTARARAAAAVGHQAVATPEAG